MSIMDRFRNTAIYFPKIALSVVPMSLQACTPIEIFK